MRIRPIRLALLLLLAIAPAIAAAFVAAATVPSQRTAAVIAQVARAEGSAASQAAIAALVYELHIKEPTYEADATYRVDRNGRMRIDGYANGKRFITECYDGQRAWQMDGDGVVTSESAKGAATLWRGTQYPGQILSLAELPAHGHRVAAIEPETIEGVVYDVLELTMSDGFQTWRYVDPRSHLITRGRDTRPLHLDVDPTETWIETAWSDFRVVDGVRRPFLSTQTDLHTGKLLQTTTVRSIRAVPNLPDRLFVAGAAAE